MMNRHGFPTIKKSQNNLIKVIFLYLKTLQAQKTREDSFIKQKRADLQGKTDSFIIINTQTVTSQSEYEHQQQ